MAGQGSPHLRWDSTAPRTLVVRTHLVCAVRVVAMLAGLSTLAIAGRLPAADLDLRLRIAWGGAQRSTWSGSISIDQGQLADLTTLGIESDVPGCVWLDQSIVHVRVGIAQDYGGVDVSVVAPEDARLTVRLRSGGAENESVIEAELGGLVAGEHRAFLDDAGNYLVITRAPGDRLRVELDRPHVLYAPGEAISLGVRVSPELVERGRSYQLIAEIARARDGEALLTQDSQFTTEELTGGLLKIPLPAPREEGVYEARLVLRPAPSLRERLVASAPIVQRRVQFVVFDSSGGGLSPAIEWREVAAIDLANPNWAARLPRLWGLDHLPGMADRPLSNVSHEVATFSGRPALVLPPTSLDDERAWVAAPLSIADPDSPHLITIDLPANQAHQVGLSILEPNAAGFVYPVTRDFGVFAPTERLQDGETWLTKQFLFWPKTTSPMLLIANEHPAQPSHIGTVRLHRALTSRAGFAEALPSEDRRIAAVLVDRPWLVESLGAREALDAANHQSVDDWQTFYDAATRLVDYVQLGGYNAAVVSIFADGGTIYPSELLQSTPRYDTGILASSAPDPLRKDVVELLLSAFDRAGLFVYLGMEFSTPLPELERLRRLEAPQESGIEWIGADGQSWSARRHGSGTAPHYNLLNERVQEAMLDVVREVVARYDYHPSLRGVAIQLSGHGYTQLLDPTWGFDDDTVNRFARETDIDVPGRGPDRFSTRANFLLGEKRKEWIAWRASVVSRFYARVRDEVHSDEPQRELLLLPTRLFARPEIRARLRPSLIAPASVVQVLFELGLDAAALANEKGLVFLRPRFDAPLSPLGGVAVEQQVNASSELDAALDEGLALGAVDLFPSMTRRRRLTSFDQLSLFGEGKSFTAPLTQMRPLGNARRRALARAVAQRDTTIYVEGGQTLVTEIDDDLRRALTVFRKLPAGDCERSELRHPPVTVRTYRTESALFVCLVNESPWKHTAEVSIEAPAGAQLLELGAAAGPLTVPSDPARTPWRVELPGYGVRAARISAASARVVKTFVEPSGAMKAELVRRIDDLNRRTQQISAHRPLEALTNPGFERPSDGESIEGWQVIRSYGGLAELSADQPQEGIKCIRVTSAGPPVSVASHAFAPPATGRLSLSAYVRRGGQSDNVRVRMFIEDALGGRYYHRYGLLGGTDRAIKPQWVRDPYRVPVDDLPEDATLPLRVRFEVSGEGTVYIDNVQLSDLSFRIPPSGVRHQPNEQLELQLIILEARQALEVGAYSDCLASLEGYWPRFLTAHVNLSDTSTRIAENPPNESPDSAGDRDAESPGMAGRIKQLLPGVLK